MLNVRIPLEVKDALFKAAAEDHGRSASGMTVRILREWLTARGYLPIDEAAGPIRKRFRIGPTSDHTLEEVGKDFEKTRKRIREIEAKALRKLRKREDE